MQLLLSPERMHWLIRRGPWLCLTGAVLMVLAVRHFHDIGFVSGLMLILFGGCTLGFRAWLTERGLWMLATVALGAFLLLYATMQWEAFRQELKGQAPRLGGLSLDTAIAVSIVWMQVRFLATVIRVNRALSRGTGRP